MLIVAGLSLKNLQPRVWDPESPHYLSSLRAVMVSYGEFHHMASQRAKAMDLGLHEFLGVPSHIDVYLDNGAFSFIREGAASPAPSLYQEFVEKVRPDWYPVGFDVIPVPQMPYSEQQECFRLTMEANSAYGYDGYVPVIHIGSMMHEYLAGIMSDHKLAEKDRIALGAIVPNLLRAPRAMSHESMLRHLMHARSTLCEKSMHVFGIGGTATLHLAALLGVDSVDSSGWRNRAARGIIQLPGSGDRMVANLGKWRGRAPSAKEWERLECCSCPACVKNGIEGLKAAKLHGFCSRATHNLWVLLDEARWLETHLRANSYADNYRDRLDNSTYLPLIAKALELRGTPQPGSKQVPSK